MCHQCFRTWEKRVNKSHMEFAREFHFSCWCVTSSVTDFDSLCNLVVLEQFKDSLALCQVATYLSERKVITAEAAGLANEYVLIHKGWSGEPGREHVG